MYSVCVYKKKQQNNNSLACTSNSVYVIEFLFRFKLNVLYTYKKNRMKKNYNNDQQICVNTFMIKYRFPSQSFNSCKHMCIYKYGYRFIVFCHLPFLCSSLLSSHFVSILYTHFVRPTLSCLNCSRHYLMSKLSVSVCACVFEIY